MDRLPQRPSAPPADPREELLRRLAEQRRQASRSQPGGAPRVGDLLTASDPVKARSGCLHPKVVEDYVAGRLRPSKLDPVREHLRSCPSCRAYAVGLRDACSLPAPARPVVIRPVLGLGHIAGLTVAGMLLMIANTTILDVLSTLDATAVAVSTARPAEPGREVVAPAPVLAAPAATAPAAPAATAPAAPAAELPPRANLEEEIRPEVAQEGAAGQSSTNETGRVVEGGPEVTVAAATQQPVSTGGQGH